ncbi:MAG: ABC transporter permease [Gordonia sp. (in: high G+C Gram-positive bacteria)]|uniref:ABC transporter permease n=1 Tax=Gordonia sp. (in: high G+C Gram-positive bacteria) TaxID=84139 RepID=UPI0039E3CAB5
MTGLVRAVRSEMAKLSWRSPVWYALVPLAIILPIGINSTLAAAAQMNKINGGGGMDTDNAAYWVIIFSTFILMAGAVTSYCGEFANRTAEIVFGISPPRWRLPVAKVVVFGAIAAGTVFLTTLANLAVLPKVFPEIWDRVDPLDPAGIRLLIGTPILALLVVVLAVGLAMIIPRAGAVIMLLLLWKWGVDIAVALIPGGFGIFLQRSSLFKNGEMGAGQSPTFQSMFGSANGSMAYFAVVSLIVFGIGLLRLTRRDVPND